MPVDAARYLVLRAEQVAGVSGFADVEEALGAATMRTQSDREPRVVVRVVADLSPDPVPRVVVTRFGDGEQP